MRDEFAQGFRVGAVPEVGSFAADFDQIFVFEFFEMMREGGCGDAQFIADVADDHSVGVGGKRRRDSVPMAVNMSA